MSLRSLLLPPFILMTLAYAGDGVPPRGSAADYPASMSPGNLTIGVACVSATTAKQIFNADLNAHGYVVFEVSVFPNSGEQADVSTAGFRLSQGADPSVARAVPPHDVAAAIYPQRSSKPETPGNVSVRSSDAIGYSTSTGSRPGANRSGVYTDTNVGVGVGRDPNAPPPPPPIVRWSLWNKGWRTSRFPKASRRTPSRICLFSEAGQGQTGRLQPDVRRQGRAGKPEAHAAAH